MSGRKMTKEEKEQSRKSLQEDVEKVFDYIGDLVTTDMGGENEDFNVSRFTSIIRHIFMMNLLMLKECHEERDDKGSHEYMELLSKTLSDVNSYVENDLGIHQKTFNAGDLTKENVIGIIQSAVGAHGGKCTGVEIKEIGCNEDQEEKGSSC